MELTFVRFGGLSSVRQEGYDPSMPGFASPPSRRGIYAFVVETIEPFLLGKDDFDSRRLEWVRDEEGRKILAGSEEDWYSKRERMFSRKYTFNKSKDGQYYLARHKKPKFFKHHGEIWHHLKVGLSQKIKENGNWVLTSTLVHKQAFWKELHKRNHNLKLYHPALFRDEFEVFIEKV